MPTAAELKATAAQLRAHGQQGALSQPAKRPAFNRPPAAASQSSGGQDAVFERLLRFSLFQATALDHVQQACNIVFVLNSSDLQQKMLKQCELWDQLKPEQPHGLDGKYVPHQLGERKLFLFVSMMDALGELQSVSSWQQRSYMCRT